MADWDNKRDDEEHQPLGMAGSMTTTFIHSPLTPLLLMACLALGILGMFITPRQEDPQISVPMVDIFVQFPGASADQVASLAIDPLERMMSEIPGVKHVYSASQRGQGMVTVQFIVGENMEPSLVKVYDKLESNMDKIPPGVSPPLVKPKGVDDVPTVTLTLWSEEVDDAALRLIGLEVMQRLKEVPHTSQNFLVGGRSEELRIEVQPQLLRGYGIGIAQLAQVIKGANTKQNVGQVETGGSSFSVYTGKFLRNADDVKRLVVGVYQGAPVYVRDVAKIIEGPGEAKSFVQFFSGPSAHFEPECGALCSIKASIFGKTEHARPPLTYGAPAVTIAIAKKTGTNGVTVSNAILEKVEFLKGRVIPDNVNVAVTRNYGKTANDKVNHLLADMAQATLMVTFLIFIALGIRPTFVVATVIPVIILVTVFSAWVLGFTIDRVSLFALIFCIGILVDDATVVVENIYRRWLEKGGVDTATTIDAVREVGNPTVLATMTIIAALLPMGFVSGMMGPYMQPIPVLGSVAMILSLFAAFIFTPWLAIRVRPSLRQLRSMQDKEHRDMKYLERFFDKTLGPLLDNEGMARVFKISIWVVFMIACSMFYTQHVAVKMLPLDNKPEFNIVVNMPEGTALPVTANVVQQLTDKLLREETKDGKPAFREVTAIQAYAGTASPFNFNGLVRHYYLRQNAWEGDIQIQLLDKEDRERSSHEIAEAARHLLTPLAKRLGANIQVVEMPPGPPVLQTLVAEVYGPDDATRLAVAKRIRKAFEDAPSVVDVDDYIPAPHDNWVFVVDRNKAEHNGVSMGSITRQLSMVMGGFKLGDVKQGRELEPRFIILQAPLAVRSEIARLGDLPVQSDSGKLIPLSSLGKFIQQRQDRIIYHKDLRPIEYVVGETSGHVTGLAAPIYGMLEVQKELEGYIPPGNQVGLNQQGFMQGYFSPPKDSFASNFEWTGEWTVTVETFRDMGLAFIAALILIYMLVVWEFGNFRLPGIIMAPIPLTLIGIIPGHWLLGAEFTATSMIGWIALAGIIVRNSILLVDFSKRAVMAGVSLREAVMQAVRTRTRPILITQLTMIAGAYTIINDPIFQGMAISLMFGAMVATLLTLFVIPLACVRAPGAYQLPADVIDAQASSAYAGGGEAPSIMEAAEPVKTNAAASAPKTGGAVKAITGVIGAVLAALHGAAGRPFAHLAATPNFIWQAVSEMFSAASDQYGKSGGGAPSGAGGDAGASKGAQTSAGASSAGASSSAGLEARPGRVVVSEALEKTRASEPEESVKPVDAGAVSDSDDVGRHANEADEAQEEVEAKTESPAAEEGGSEEAASQERGGNEEESPLSNGSTGKGQAPTDTSLPSDDLKEINGIGPKIERILNAQGIKTFKQLAALDIESLQLEESVIDLAGRVKREDWIGQARKLSQKSD